MLGNLVQSVQIISPMDIRDIVWQTFTSCVGWPVQSFWPLNHDDGKFFNLCRCWYKYYPFSIEMITATCRSYDKQIMICGNNSGKLILSNYPAPQANVSCFDFINLQLWINYLKSHIA